MTNRVGDVTRRISMLASCLVVLQSDSIVKWLYLTGFIRPLADVFFFYLQWIWLTETSMFDRVKPPAGEWGYARITFLSMTIWGLHTDLVSRTLDMEEAIWKQKRAAYTPAPSPSSIRGRILLFAGIWREADFFFPHCANMEQAVYFHIHILLDLCSWTKLDMESPKKKKIYLLIKN